MSHRNAFARCCGAFLLTLAAAANAGQATDTGWHFLIQPYAMFPNMRGETAVGVLPAVPVDEDPQDIFENLQLGAMLYAEAHNSRWAFSSDVIYMKLEADVSANNIVTDGSAEVSQLGWELAILGRLSEWIELGVAATYNRIEPDVDITFNAPAGAVTRGAGMTEDWIDPSMVVRSTIPLGDKWFLQGRGNIGGFGVGSDLYWQLQGDVGYRHSDRFLFAFGYRVISLDYDRGSGRDRFAYNMTTFGPVLRFGFTF